MYRIRSNIFAIFFPDKRFPCDYCRAMDTFKTRKELLGHILNEHPFRCPLCPNLKLVKLVRSMQKHVRTLHPYSQVWPLTQFISLLPFLEKKPSSWKDFSLFLPSTLSSPSRNLEGLFELTPHPSRAPIIAHTTLN